MLTKITIRNFKRFKEEIIELGSPVVFIGPNNSGKTTALQALALWEVGVKRWNEKRKGKKTSPDKRPGVTINRRDLIALPVPDSKLLWHQLFVRDVKRDKEGKPITQNVRIDIIIEGISEGVEWKCGLEFDYANQESFYCRPLRLNDTKNPKRMEIPEESENILIAFLPPMSGLASNENRLDPGAINVRVGEGRTAEVLRNLCYKIHEEKPEKWNVLKTNIKTLFGLELEAPEYIAERGEIVMHYNERQIKYDISSSGKGLQQTLLLLTYMYSNPGAILLLDEPDAHLEILRQRQIYQLIYDVAQENQNQIIIASHSEVILNEAAERDVVVAFVGKPHRIDDRGAQVLKSLKDYGFEHYYQAEQTGWVLYLEGSTDLAILKKLAFKLEHNEAIEVLQRPYVYYVSNDTSEVQKHFYGLKDAIENVKGIAIFDNLGRELPANLGPEGYMWNKREIENYLCYPEVLIAFATASVESEAPGPLFHNAYKNDRYTAMNEAIDEIINAMETLGKGSPWDGSTKVSDDFLKPLFKSYFKKLNLYNIMDKKNFHELALYIEKDKIDTEVIEKLNAIVKVAKSAKGRDDND